MNTYITKEIITNHAHKILNDISFQIKGQDQGQRNKSNRKGDVKTLYYQRIHIPYY